TAMVTAIFWRRSGAQAVPADASCQNRPKRKRRLWQLTTRRPTRSRLLPASSHPSPSAISHLRQQPRGSPQPKPGFPRSPLLSVETNREEHESLTVNLFWRIATEIYNLGEFQSLLHHSAR